MCHSNASCILLRRIVFNSSDCPVPDHRKHRGPHPEDKQLFADEHVLRLREAASDLAWLFNRGYASTSALKIVGDRYSLVARQRVAVARCTCSDEATSRRQRHHIQADQLEGRELWIDGYNVLTSLEAALSGGVILHARDGCYRDMASMHGSYRKVEETIPALHILGDLLAEWKVASCRWLFDQPVSNSGRLKTVLQEIAEERGWNWNVFLVPDPDRDLIATDQIVASADSQVLDSAAQWFNLARVAIELRVAEAWLIRLDV